VRFSASSGRSIGSGGLRKLNAGGLARAASLAGRHGSMGVGHGDGGIAVE